MKELNTKVENVKVLVVEDIALNQLLMKTLLDDFGFELDIADNGKTAIDKLQNNSYDIILMDLHMPEMNGFEATEYIRNKMNSQIPIIALTADVTTADLRRCTAVGMNDYISKPLDEQLLYGKILKLLKIVDLSKDSQIPPVKARITNLTYLNQRTKANPELMTEMIGLYLKQTLPLISKLKQSMNNNDWNSVYEAAHKLIPSFSIMGINKDFEETARKIQEYSNTKKQLKEVPEMALQLETICSKACEELEEELNIIKKSRG
jgi:CheY-like chemotaxis protein